MKNFGQMGAFLDEFALRLVDGSLRVPHVRFGILDVLALTCLQLKKPLGAIAQALGVRLGGSRTLEFRGCLLVRGSGFVDVMAVNVAKDLSCAHGVANACRKMIDFST